MHARLQRPIVWRRMPQIASVYVNHCVYVGKHYQLLYVLSQMNKWLKSRSLIILIDVPVVQYEVVLCPIIIHFMTRHTSPMGHVLIEDLPDRHCLLGSPLGSCNKNKTYTTTCSRHYIKNYLSQYLCIHVLLYLFTHVLMYSCTLYTCTHVLSSHLIYLYTCTRVLCTHALMYLYTCTRVLCTHALLYYSSQCTPYCYRHYVYDKHFGLYTVHIWSSK